jgi:hypothetical protein
MKSHVCRLRHDRRISSSTAIVALAILLAGITGCPLVAVPDTAGFSESELVALGPDTVVETPLGAGAPSLANSTWAVHRTEDDSLLFRLEFGPDGELQRVFDSFVLAQPWLGSEVMADTQAHATVYPGGSYIFGAYAAEQDDNFGILGHIHGLLLGTHLGTGTISFFGPLGNERVDGTFVRTVTIIADTPFPAPGDARIDVYALRQP